MRAAAVTGDTGQMFRARTAGMCVRAEHVGAGVRSWIPDGIRTGLAVSCCCCCTNRTSRQEVDAARSATSERSNGMLQLDLVYMVYMQRQAGEAWTVATALW